MMRQAGKKLKTVKSPFKNHKTKSDSDGSESIRVNNPNGIFESHLCKGPASMLLVENQFADLMVSKTGNQDLPEQSAWRQI